MVTIKRTLVVVAAAFAVASTSAMAQGVKMSDAQLDEITAAGAFNAVIISNPGNANVARNVDPENLMTLERNIKCINCVELGPVANDGRSGGALAIVNRGHPMIKLVGGGLVGF